MQNPNPVIKNYILSSEPLVLDSEENVPHLIFTPDSYLYHKLSVQNTDEISLFL